MINVNYVSHAIEDRKRHEMLFRGDFIIFTSVPKMQELCAFVDLLSREAFGGLEPETAHLHMEPQEFLNIVRRLQPQYTNHPTAKSLFKGALQQCGVNIETTYWDWFPLRIQPGKRGPEASVTSGYAAHRDSWFCNIQQQSNWWGPIYPIGPGRTMAFYPSLFAKPVPNDSEGWDLHEFRTARSEVRSRHGSDTQLRSAYRYIQATENLPPELDIRFVIEPGSLINFSAAHLHASVPNVSDKARFSTEVRTINLDILKDYAGAPNVDGVSTGNSVEDFFRINDGVPLKESIGP